MSGRRQTARSGFTLIELLIAMLILATLVAALAGTLAGTFRARARVAEILDKATARSTLIQTVEQDLRHMVVPAGTLAGPMLGETEAGTGGYRNDRLEFYTASGVLEADAPWGDIRKVVYALEIPEDAMQNEGLALTRSITRNLLPNTEETTEADVLLRNVAGLSIQYLQSSTWLDTWDSTAEDNAPPEAVWIRIDLLPEQDGAATPRPIEALCEIACQPSSSAVEGGVAS